ncbi:FMRFamide peptide receptor frpr-18-like [Physella acuta]|uniref:FMRFamide peptide receptor frpr-18-like n=1 Tax=Physella acuta TaxID=109671 RepID=UPI0027DDE95C|nr:FMRFamide peptide receptor frpr-18-like [Physella acuta]
MSADVFIVDDEVTAHFVFTAFCLMIAVACLGIISNGINLAVFIKQGFKDTMNISLFSLAVCDLCSLLPLIWLGLVAEPQFFGPPVWYVGMEINFLTAGWPHTIFARLTSWITAYVTLERCVCVATPLKVKLIFTPTRAKYSVIVIYILVLAGVIPTYATHSLAWRFFPNYNTTMLGLRLTDNAWDVTKISNIFTNPLSAITSFCVVLSCTAVIVCKLNEKTKWRKQTTSKRDDKKSVTRKERKAVKMVTMLAVIFLISVTPSIILVIITDVTEDFSLTGKYRNMFFITYCVTFLLEAINSGSNFFVYYSMNTKYRRTLAQMVGTK